MQASLVNTSFCVSWAGQGNPFFSIPTYLSVTSDYLLLTPYR